MYSMRLPVFLLLTLCAGLSRQEEDGPRVNATSGAIRGYYKTSLYGRQYEAYEGIPYAQSPTGELRFKPPQPVEEWDEELNATEHGSDCIQYSHIPGPNGERISGSEDCLFLNVYVPDRDLPERADGTLLPVMVWIHGGAFQFGNGRGGARFLMDRDIVFVGINYRLGPFGFLSTEDEVVPGNMGLMDQNMALRWVSENIEYFGGDPEKVTLIGLSAGGASVHYHYMSPLSAGLFRGGISASGTALDSWTQTEKSLEKAKELARILECPNDNTEDMISCFRELPAENITAATPKFMGWLYNPFTPFGPVVDKYGDAPFLTCPPAEIISQGKIQDLPWITGVVSEEGLYPAAEFVASDELLKDLNDNWVKYAPHLLDFNYTIPVRDHARIARRIKRYYLGWRKIRSSTVDPLIQLVGDRLFVVDSEKAARMQAKVNKNPVHYYYYSYRATQSFSEALSGTDKDFGVSHADDVSSVIDGLFVDPTLSDDDEAMQQHLIDFWVSFVTDGEPKIADVNWPPVDPYKTELRYMHMASPEKIFVETNKNLGRKRFWESIRFDENRVCRADCESCD